MKNILKSIIIVLAITLTSLNVIAQDGNAKPSPIATTSGKINTASIVIVYSSPSVKGREIWGVLVPYDQIWRAGADEATTFTTDKNLIVEGKELSAGTYSFFVIPKKIGPWTIIFNKESKQWGAYKYKQTKDALRVEVSVKTTTDKYEGLKYEVKNNQVILAWKNTIIPINIKTK